MQDSLAKGLPVHLVTEDSPAERAGIRVGDVILFANGVRIDSVASYVKARQANPDTLSVTVQRGYQFLDFEIQISAS